MFINKLPDVGEERYWVFIDYDNKPSIAKVKTLRRWYDKNSRTTVIKVKVIENIFGNFIINAQTNLDYPWHMQKTLEDARKLMIVGIFKGENAFFRSQPPWE